MLISCAEYIFFYTIVANFNGPLAAVVDRIDDATHIKVAKYEATLTLKFVSHQTIYEAVATLLRKRFLSAEDMSFPTIIH